MSSVVGVSEIAKILCNDDLLLKDKTTFAIALRIPTGTRKQLEDQFAMFVSSAQDYFIKILEIWIKSTSPTLRNLVEILNANRFMSASYSVGALGKEDAVITVNEASASTAIKTVSFGIVPPSSFFVGRIEEVEEINKYFESSDPRRICVVSGMGGQGKTELCRQFCKLQAEKEHPPALTWLNGDGASDLRPSLSRLAKALQIPISNEEAPITFNELIVQISDKITANSSTGWVVVIDNVDEAYEEFLQAIPVFQHSAFVLVTSRNIGILSGEARQLKLDTLKEDEARDLVQKCLHIPQPETDINSLSKELGNHALAIRQSVAYINAEQNEDSDDYGIQDYIQELTKGRNLLQNRVVTDGYPDTIFLVVNQTMNKIQKYHGSIGGKAAKLMEILCLMRPEGIMVDCFKRFLTTIEKKDQLPKIGEDLRLAFRLLKKYFMISSEGQNISIHRLVQKLAKSDYSKKCVQILVEGSDPETFSDDELEQMTIILRHLDKERFLQIPEFYLSMLARSSSLRVLPMEANSVANIDQLIAQLTQEMPLLLEMGEAVTALMNDDVQGYILKIKEWVSKTRSIFGNENPVLGMNRLQTNLRRFENVFADDEMEIRPELVEDVQSLMNDLIHDVLTANISVNQLMQGETNYVDPNVLEQFRPTMETIRKIAAQVMGKGGAFYLFSSK